MWILFISFTISLFHRINMKTFFCFSYQSFVLFMFLMIFFFSGFPARFFSGFSCGSLLFLQVIISSFWIFLIKVSFFWWFFFFFGFPAVLSYFSRLLFLLFGFFLSRFRSFHVSTVYLPLCCSHGWFCVFTFTISLFHSIKMKYFLVFLIKVSFFFMFLQFICFFVVHIVDSVFFDNFDSIKMIFIYISVSAATGSGSGMDFQAPRWDLFLPLFVCPHVFFPFFTFLLI